MSQQQDILEESPQTLRDDITQITFTLHEPKSLEDGSPVIIEVIPDLDSDLGYPLLRIFRSEILEDIFDRVKQTSHPIVIAIMMHPGEPVDLRNVALTKNTINLIVEVLQRVNITTNNPAAPGRPVVNEVIGILNHHVPQINGELPGDLFDRILWLPEVLIETQNDMLNFITERLNISPKEA